MALMKILKLKTGFTGRYTPYELKNLSFSINKFSDTDGLRFGVTSNDGTVGILDNDKMIKTMYDNDLLFKNVSCDIYVDNVKQGTFFIKDQNSNNGTDLWNMNFVDKMELYRDIKLQSMDLKSRTLTEVINFVLSPVGIEYIWETGAKEYCDSIVIEQSYFQPNQTFYQLLLKCCQIGLLRMYCNRDGVLEITRGV